jgi:hypothetical protein
MKVLLLRPAAEKKSMARVLPLGLLAIGSVLKRAGHQVKITVAIFHGPRWLFLPMGMFLVALTTGWEVLIMRVVILLGMERGLASFANELKMKKYFQCIQTDNNQDNQEIFFHF